MRVCSLAGGQQSTVCRYERQPMAVRPTTAELASAGPPISCRPLLPFSSMGKMIVTRSLFLDSLRYKVIAVSKLSFSLAMLEGGKKLRRQQR